MAKIKNMGTATMKFGEGIVVSGSDSDNPHLYVSGNISLDQYIYHNGDDNTYINFSDDRMRFYAGAKLFLDIEEKSSAPHEVTINGGGNNVDFIVKGNGSNEGNPLFKCDGSTGRVGINGVGTPTVELDVDGDIKARGDLYADKIRRSSDSDTTTKILLNDELIKLYAGHSSEDIVRVGDTNIGDDNNFWVSGSIDSKDSATDRGTAIFGGDVVISGSLYARQRQITTHKFNSTGTGKKYVKFDTSGQVGSPGVNNRFVVPARGLLESVTIRTAAAADSTDIALHKASDGTANVSTTATEAITVDIASANTAYKAEFTSNAAFGEGEIVCISVNPTSAPNDVVLTAVWKFDFVN
jgi:ribosomal protein L27